MFRFLKNIFGLNQKVRDKAPRAEVSLPSTQFPRTMLIDQFNSRPWQAKLDIDHLFFKYLFGTSAGDAERSDNSLDEKEKAIILALEEVCQSELAGSNLVPRVPYIVPQILKSLRDDNVSNSELAFHIAKDLVLVSELIHEVNTAHYSPNQKVINLDKAVQLLGQNGLRLLVAKVAFRPIFNIQSGKFSKEITPKLWDHAEKCSLACRALTRGRKQNHFAGFLAGLVQNVGLVVASRVVDYMCEDSARPTSAAFEKALLTKARELTYRIAEEWDFPEDVLFALRGQLRHHDDLSDLSLSLRQADQLSKIYLLVQAKQLDEDDPLLLLDQDAKIEACYRDMALVKEE